jgi:predicted aspartyl protease
MGFVHVAVKVLPPGNGREPAEVDALVDTGAIYSVLPGGLPSSLGERATGRRTFRTIDGQPIDRDIGAVEMEIDGKLSLIPVPVIFGGESDKAVVGVTTLEIMGLQVDPVAGELKSTDLLLLCCYQGG